MLEKCLLRCINCRNRHLHCKSTRPLGEAAPRAMLKASAPRAPPRRAAPQRPKPSAPGTVLRAVPVFTHQLSPQPFGFCTSSMVFAAPGQAGAGCSVGRCPRFAPFHTDQTHSTSVTGNDMNVAGGETLLFSLFQRT